MPEDFDSPDSPFIRIARNGTVTNLAAGPGDAPRRATRSASSRAAFDDAAGYEDMDEDLEPAPVRRTRGSRPMPKRLSEEAREAAEAAEAAEAMSAFDVEEEPAPVKPTRKRTRKSTKKNEPEQIALPLKPARTKQDATVKQRQVLGFSFIVIAICVFLMIVSYTPDDAPFAETRISDIPAIFTGSNPIVNAHADQVHNWFKLMGAMCADFLINKTIGYAAIIYPIFFGWWSLAFFRFTYKQRRRLTLATTFFLITAVLFSATMGTAANFAHIPREWSGAVGQFLGTAFTRLIGSVGAFIAYASAFIITLVFSIDLDIEKTFLRLKGYWVTLVLYTRRKLIEFWDKREARKLERERLREEEEAAELEAENAQALEDEALAIASSETDETSTIVATPIAEVEDAEAAPVVVRKRAATRSAKPAELAREEPQEKEPMKIVRTTAGAASAAAIIGSATPAAAATPSVVANIASAVTTANSASAAATATTAASASQVIPGQPLLKVRPAPKTPSGGPIPRMRPDQNKLGERSVNFSRLTNGAITPDTPASPSIARTAAPTNSVTHDGPSAIAPPAVEEAGVSSTDGVIALPATEPQDAHGLRNVDTSEEMIAPIAPRAKSVPTERPIAQAKSERVEAKQDATESRLERQESKVTVRSQRPEPAAWEDDVAVGDEKTLSNDALPHSMTEEYRDVVREHQTASKTAAREVDAFKRMRDEASEGADLFYEEGQKPFVPENPYQEILLKYRHPSLELLTPADPKDALDADDEELAAKGRLLRDKLATFGVEIENITVTPGPVVTLYEFTPAEGIKVSRVENLTDDIALAMKARGIRIIAPIPGRGTIGVEIPNDVPKMVRIRSLFESDSFRNTKMNLPLALGKTISGDVYVDDLNKMPHLLIAGATGSGKSVGVNGILASLLYSKSPRDVKFVIVDPKKIELSLYKKLRKHFLIVSPEAGEDIVTTPQFAVLALKAVELEMEKRYDKLAKAAVRSLADYNLKVAQGKLRSTQEEQHYHLPYIVVIIDELADLMITAGREIEEPICRIAQMARAVGIHLILATQRPSVDVITGVIKANFPARIAFQVATRVDSRTILDSMGAEQLLGNGDMLYQPSGTPKPIRLQSPYISTEEVEAIVDAVAMQEGDKLSYSRTWTLPSLKQKDGRGGSTMEDENMRDDLFEEAARVIVRHQQGSVSLLQRRLKVGYSRAARIVDELEQAGIVGPFDGSKARQVLCESDAELEVVLEGLR